MEIYVVQPGDTLFRIAQRFGVTVAGLQSLNQLPNPDQLVIGQALLIPTPAREPLRYTVQPGDTLFQLAQLFGISVAALVQANNITNPTQIQVGTVLVIPEWSEVSYTVRPGDTLFQIANRFGVPLNLLIRVNQITDPSRIFPGQTLIIPQRIPVVIPRSAETLAYFQSYFLTGLERSLSQIGQFITYGALFHFPVNPEGDIIVPAGVEQAVAIMLRNNVRPLLTLTNWGPTGTFDSDIARAIIGNETVKARTIQNLVALLRQYNFTGVNVDFENMYPEDRALYTDFIRDMGAVLRPEGFILTMAVPPKFSDLPTAPWVGAFDYAALGQLADIIFLMTYEWGWIGGPPSPVAPVNLVRRTLDYATTLIPANKIIQGVPFYGYNWVLPDTPENQATPENLVNIYNLAYQAGTVINYDQTAQTPWFRYTDSTGLQHEVWFEDARSVRAKYEVAYDFNLRGVGYWSFTNEPYGFPQNWPVLSEFFVVSK